MRSLTAVGFAVALGLAIGVGFVACGPGEDHPDAGCVPTPEVCNHLDDDCDGVIDNGFALAVPCDGPDTDLCNEGVTTCAPDGGVACSDVSGNNKELCNGIDDDCDGQTDEDFELNQPCDGTDSDLCTDGVTVCHPNQLAVICDDSGENNLETCNGRDDDCDGIVDNGFNTGAPCDGPDSDSCKEGVIVCDSPTTTRCTDQTGDNVEFCNGRDDNCDGVNDDVTFGLGSACDGPDSDACLEGTFVCKADGSGVQCSDNTGDDVETCNGLDDDCDGQVDEDFNTGAPCDGPDTDRCTDDGVVECASLTTTRCSAPSGNNVETCNGRDDDCDGVVDNVPVCCGQVNGPFCDSDKGETCFNCPGDCHDNCGDGCCNGSESHLSCPRDCP